MQNIGRPGVRGVLNLNGPDGELYSDTPVYKDGLVGRAGNYFGNTARAGVAALYLAGITGASVFALPACNNSPTQPTDMCLNIEGRQVSVPYGYTRDQSGNCYPIPPATSSITLTLRDTLTGRPINGFNYDVCSVDVASLSKQVEGMTEQQAAQVVMSASTEGMKPAPGSTITEVVRNGACTWKFSGGDIEIPREVETSVNGNLSDYVSVIGGGSNFPVQHYIDITSGGGGSHYKPEVKNFSVYTIDSDLWNDAQNSTPVINELYNGYNATYMGSINAIPSNPSDGSIYVRRDDSIIVNGQSAAGTTEFHTDGGYLQWALVRVLKGTGSLQNTTRHEFGRAVCGASGSSPDSTSLFYIFGNPSQPNDKDKAACAFNDRRPIGNILTTTSDRSIR